MKVLPIATFVNVATVIVGSLIGIFLQQIFPENVQNIVFQAVGLGTLLIGIQMSLKLPDGYMLILIFSMIIGGILGEIIQLDVIFNGLSESLKNALSIEESNFSEGLITAFLLFCVGSMTIVGAIEEGISGNRELLLVKSTLDGFTSIALASVFGKGVLFSVIPMLIFQGGITILAGQLKNRINTKVIDGLAATGGILIIGISINMLQMGKIILENLLPALLVVLILSIIFEKRKKSREQDGSIAT